MNALNVNRVCDQIHNILTENLPELAIKSNFIKRKRTLTPAAFVRGLVLAWASNPDASLKELAASVAVAGSPIAPQSLNQRFTPSAARFLRYVLETIATQKLKDLPAKLPLLGAIERIYMFDSSTIALPHELRRLWKGCGGSNGKNSALKVHIGLEYRHGELVGPHISDGKLHDRSDPLHRGPFPKNSLIINDLGYFSLESFENYEKNGLFWLSRLMINVKVFNEEGKEIDLKSFLSKEKADFVDLPVLLGQKKHKSRWIALRVPQKIANERRRRLHSRARDKGQTVSQKRLALCEWTLFVTNIRASSLTPKAVLKLYRLRWQIELMFRLWKKGLKIGKSKSCKVYRVLCEIYAKLIGAILQHWLICLTCWEFADRSMEKSSELIRKYLPVLEIALASDNRVLMIQAIGAMRDAVARTGRINKSKKTPRTWQLFLSLEEMEPERSQERTLSLAA